MTPKKFLHLLPAKELKRICRSNDLPTTATWWLTTALTLFLAYQGAQPRAMAEVRKELRDLIRKFERLREAIRRPAPEIRWELDAYVEGSGPKPGEWTVYPTADPNLELFNQYLDELLKRARAVKVPQSGSGRRKALPTLAMVLLASYLREIKPGAVSQDLARLAEGLLDPVLPGNVAPPRWAERAKELWPDRAGSRAKST